MWRLWWETPRDILLPWLQRKHVQDCCSVSYSQQGESWPSTVVTFKELKANPQLASLSPVLCPEHYDEFRFFDKDCGRVICGDCHALNHRGHNRLTLDEAASKYRKELEELVTKASSQAEKIKAAEGQVMRASDSMKKACKERNDEIQEFFQKVRHVFVISAIEIEAAKICWDYKNHLRVRVRKWETDYQWLSQWFEPLLNEIPVRIRSHPGVSDFDFRLHFWKTIVLLFLKNFCVSISGVRPLIGYDRLIFGVVSKTKHSKTKTEARSTQISKTKHPKLENEAPKTRKRSTQNSQTKHPNLETIVGWRTTTLSLA